MHGVELVKVTKRFGNELAVRGVDLTIGTGEFVSLLGPSGCGKSTTLRMIAGLEKPDAGRVILAGRDVTDLPIRSRQVGMVFQSLALFPHMTVSQNVAFGLRMRRLPAGDIAARVSGSLAMVRLERMADKLPKQLSGGQQQRVALARALVIEPRVLLLDEPLSALDRNLREEMQGEIRRITRTVGITAVFVTHDQHEAFALSDRIAVMNSGQIEQLDRPQDLFRRPRTAFVAGFTGVSNIFTARRDGSSDHTVLSFGTKLVTAQTFPGGSFHIGLRPEDVRVTPADKSAPEGALHGRVTKIVYLGTTIEIEVALNQSEDVRLTARLPSGSWHSNSDAPSEGKAVWLSWDPNALLVLDR
jgi:spermidine/putrescine ABC transporter ATP-binding subunit